VEAGEARASARFSAELIRQIAHQGRTQTEIAVMLGVTKSFVSRVATGQRALTIEHLAKLEQALGKPVALLLMEGATDDGPQRERQRLRGLLRRPGGAAEDRPLTAREQNEAQKLSEQIDRRLARLSRQGASILSASRRVSDAPGISKVRVIGLLKRQAGLSPTAARRVYEVQAQFAEKRGLVLFGK
jgi:transcriptional regulator with XRE-family HTH domain